MPRQMTVTFRGLVVHAVQFCYECLLVGSQLLRCDLIGAIEQVGHRFVDLMRHVLCTDLPPAEQQTCGVPTTLLMTTF